MVTLVTIIHVLVALFLILAVLLQSGKGGMGALTGTGAEAMFGSRGPATFLSKLTAGFAIVFFLTSLTLAHYSSKGSSRLQEEATPQTTDEETEAPVEKKPQEQPQTGDGETSGTQTPAAPPAEGGNAPKAPSSGN